MSRSARSSNIRITRSTKASFRESSAITEPDTTEATLGKLLDVLDEAQGDFPQLPFCEQ
jgi:hypothetical protein